MLTTSTLDNTLLRSSAALVFKLDFHLNYVEKSFNSAERFCGFQQSINSLLRSVQEANVIQINAQSKLER